MFRADLYPTKHSKNIEIDIGHIDYPSPCLPSELPSLICDGSSLDYRSTQRYPNVLSYTSLDLFTDSMIKFKVRWPWKSENNSYGILKPWADISNEKSEWSVPAACPNDSKKLHKRCFINSSDLSVLEPVTSPSGQITFGLKFFDQADVHPGYSTLGKYNDFRWSQNGRFPVCFLLVLIYLNPYLRNPAVKSYKAPNSSNFLTIRDACSIMKFDLNPKFNWSNKILEFILSKN